MQSFLWNSVWLVIFLTPFLHTGITQPTYVNMHELASMAANKAQSNQDSTNLPPPPAEFTTPSNEKVQ